MKYNSRERRAIKSLASETLGLFQVIEKEERGEIVGIEELCRALSQKPTFIIFSCLAGDKKREELRQDLGALFTTSLKQKAEQFTVQVKASGVESKFVILVDDQEPTKCWGWKTLESEITIWCRMLIEESVVPADWEVLLWSDVARRFLGKIPMPDIKRLQEVPKSIDAQKLFHHMDKFPNKGLRGMSTMEAFTRKLSHYEQQGEIIKQAYPNAILIQTETPWEVKDPLFRGLFGESVGSIIHPFERRR